MKPTHDAKFYISLAHIDKMMLLQFGNQYLDAKIENSITDGETQYRVFNNSLCYFLTSGSIPAINQETQEKVLISGLDYVESYKDGYKEGVDFFLKTYTTRLEVSFDLIIRELTTKYKNDYHTFSVTIQHPIYIQFVG